MSATRRNLIKAALFGPAAIAPSLVPISARAEQFESLFNLDSYSLKSLASKVVPELPPAVQQTAIARLANQLQMLDDCLSDSTTLPLLHADDLAHNRTVSLHGLIFSQTQIGILALLGTTNRGLT